MKFSAPAQAEIAGWRCTLRFFDSAFIMALMGNSDKTVEAQENGKAKLQIQPKKPPGLNRRAFIIAAAVFLAAAIIFFILVFWIPNRFERFFLLLPIAYCAYRQIIGRPVYRNVSTITVIITAWVIYLFLFPLPFSIGRPDMVFRFISIPILLWIVHGVFLLFVGVRFLVISLLRRAFRRPAEKSAGKPEKALGLVINALIFVTLFFPVFLYIGHFHRAKFTARVTPMTQFGAEFENVTLTTSDNLRLSAWFIPAADKSDTTVIFSHGISANKGNFLPFAEDAWARGANVLIYDSRGHGESDGWSISLGYAEKEDVRAAVDYLKKHRAEEARRIVAWGCSAGSGATVLAAAEIKEIDAVILDSPIASFAGMVRDFFGSAPGFIRSYVVFLARILAWLDFGVDIEHDSPVENIWKISPRPVFIVSGSLDQIVPPECGKRLYAAAKEPKHFLLVEGEGHVVGAGSSETYSAYLDAAIAGGEGRKSNVERQKSKAEGQKK